MGNLKKISLSVGALLATTIITSGIVPGAASAADLPPVVELPPEVVPQSYGGWYLRGDIGYAKQSVQGVSYFQGASQTGSFETHDIDSSWMIGGGIGYQINDWFRVDLTADYYATADFTGSSAQNVTCNNVVPIVGNCSYTDTGSVQVTTLLANAYVDLGTWQGLTPYVGAGIGGALMHWGDLTNTEYEIADPSNSVTDVHGKRSGWRFAYGLHAGASYDISAKWKLDAGYSFTHITGGEMFGFGATSGLTGTQGYNDDMKIHAWKLGVRYLIN